jgi:hypothetical protein
MEQNISLERAIKARKKTLGFRGEFVPLNMYQSRQLRQFILEETAFLASLLEMMGVKEESKE